MNIDPTTNLGRIRLRIADVSDMPYLSDSVIAATLEDNGNNLNRTAKACAMYILGMMSHKTHRKMGQLEVWGAESFSAYKQFLIMTQTNPAFMDISPIPYSSTEEFSPIRDFQANWNKGFVFTEAQQLAANADNSANDNSRTGVF